MEIILKLTEQEVQTVIACMSYAPARECVPLMNKISAQATPQIAGNNRDIPATIPTNNAENIDLKRSN